jgi:hypothetical protein
MIIIIKIYQYECRHFKYLYNLWIKFVAYTTPLIKKMLTEINDTFIFRCKFLVVGGGTGGCTMAAKLSKMFNKAPNHVIILEPNEVL